MRLTDLHNILQKKQRRHQEVQNLLADPNVYKDQKNYQELSKEFAHLHKLIELWEHFLSLQAELEDTQELMQETENNEMRIMATEEIQRLEQRKKLLHSELELALIPPDPLEQKSVIIEIRAGTGGQEAALFAGELYRMYWRFAEAKRWKPELLSYTQSDLEGFKEVIFAVNGQEAYGHFRYESGTHRVQRVPVTESSGRLQTSAATVAVLPEMEDTEVEIRDSDLRIDVFRAQGAGGQHVNTTDSAVRITYLPLNLVVTCQDEKSQLKNKQKALKVLRTRISAHERQQQEQARSQERKEQVGTGDRSQRIRTYNFPQNRVTDHRIGLTLYSLEAILQGELDELIAALKLHLPQPPV